MVRLYEWLRDEAQALEPRNMAPTEENVRNRFGLSLRFEAELAALDELYTPNRDASTIQVKRHLWRELLVAALGEAVDNEQDVDRLFLRHTYLAVVVGLAVQSAFGIDVHAESQSNSAGLLNGQTFVDATGVRGVLESDFFSWPAESGRTMDKGTCPPHRTIRVARRRRRYRSHPLRSGYSKGRSRAIGRILHAPVACPRDH